jgi:hypothetical protein
MNINVQDQNALYDKLRTVTSDIYRQAVDVVKPIVESSSQISDRNRALATATAAVQLTSEAQRQGLSPSDLRETVIVDAEITAAKDDMRRALDRLSTDVEGWNDQGIDFTADAILSFDSVESLLTKINQIKSSEFYDKLRDKGPLDRALSNVVESYKRLAKYDIRNLD